MTPMKKAYATRVRSDLSPLWKGRRPLLSRLDIELTERCNNDCLHCSINRPAGDEDARSREMDTGFIKDLLDQAAALGCLTVRFTGGEPLLRSDFEDLYLRARNRGMRVMIFTNATLVTPRLAGLLSRVPPLEKMEVSVYGMSERTSLAVTRNPGAFEAARRGLRLLADHRLPFVLKSVVLPSNRNEREELGAWAAGLTGVAAAPAFAVALDLRSRPDPVRSGLIRGLRLPPREAAGYMTGMDRDGGEERRRFVAEHGGARGGRLFTCLEGGGGGAVDAYGRFQYCLTLRHPDTVYDLKRGSLREAVREMPPRLRRLRARDPEYLRRCGRCFLKTLCLQCPAKSWAEHGTLDTPVGYFCEIAHAQAEALGLLAAGEKAWTVADWGPRVGQAASTRTGRGEESGPCPGG